MCCTYMYVKVLWPLTQMPVYPWTGRRCSIICQVTENFYMQIIDDTSSRCRRVNRATYFTDHIKNSTVLTRQLAFRGCRRLRCVFFLSRFSITSGLVIQTSSDDISFGRTKMRESSSNLAFGFSNAFWRFGFNSLAIVWPSSKVTISKFVVCYFPYLLVGLLT